MGGGKTEAGTDRYIAISNKILPLIKNRIGDMKKGKLVLINNKEIKYSKLNEIFGNIMLSLGLNHLPHDTRHTFATLLSNADANTASIRKMMGHSSYEITEKIYTHKEITEFINAVDLLE
ncbi:tyrosine-type recombinase/integrase [Oceanivirga miroungae]|nr:tyrosine-type recombinase/integrase [Oceanivirga miroungae]